MNTDAELAEAVTLTQSVAKRLTKATPTVAGAALADCLAMWIAAHPQEMRELALEMHVRMVRRLIVANLKMMKDEEIES